MAKRFSATEIWEEDWFLDMPNDYKLFWFFMLARCDHAGVFKPNVNGFIRSINKKIDLTKAFTFFNTEKERVAVTSKKNWWIIDFFVFQYGNVFNTGNNLHLSIYKIYNQQDIDLRTNRGLKEVRWGTWSGLIEDFDTLKEKDKVLFNIDKVKQPKNGESKNQQFRSAASQGADVYARLINAGSVQENNDNGS